MVYIHDLEIVDEISDLGLNGQFERVRTELCAEGFDVTRRIQHKGKNIYAAVGRETYVVGERVTLPEFLGDEVICLFRVVRPDDPILKGGQLDTAVAALIRSKFISDAKLVEFYRDEKKKSDEPIPGPIKPPLPEKYFGWITPTAYKTVGEKDQLSLVVLETRSWQKNIKQEAVRTHLSEFHSLLSPFYLEDFGRVDSPILRWHETNYFIVCGKYGDSIICEYDGSVQDNRKLKLITLLSPALKCDEKPDLWIAESLAKGVLTGTDYQVTRAYPGILLWREMLENDAVPNGSGKHLKQWIEIETEDSAANIYMSEEEIGILKDLTDNAENLPTFINGPAGSGKSTILHYLFAHFIMQKRETPNRFAGKPLYLTLSDRLLESAKKTVFAILKLDPEYATVPESDIQKSLNGSFFPFRKLLREIIGADRSLRYKDGDEIDFERFKDLLLNNQKALGTKFKPHTFKQEKLRRDISPELCWHLIRSYIKGFLNSSFVTPEDFRSIRQKELFVDEADYQYVFTRVWPWYKDITCGGNSGLWDQQDMAREALDLLNSGAILLSEGMREFTTVFCDEAQDLTGIELQLVQQMSCLMKYDFSNCNGVPAIPFAFAGDPLQALNPSGFRWENLKDNVYRNIIQPLDPKRSLRQQRLTFNYRSPSEITYLANAVQLSRKMIFGDTVKPQVPYYNAPGTPIFHIFDKEKVLPLDSKEISNFKGSIILLPCSEGQERESEFISKYNLLKQLKNADPNQVFMSVLSAKGLDIQHVVIFAFAEELFSQSQLTDEMDGECSDIALAYALNKIYVAITRSKDQVLILDTQDGDDHFWGRIGDPSFLNRYLERLGNESSSEADSWRVLIPKGDLRQWDPGRPGGFLELEADKMREQANSLFEDALGQRSYQQMERAANFYARINDDHNERICKAYACEYRGDMKEAAEIFVEINEIEEARKCYWAAMAWQELITHSKQLRTSARQLAVSRLLCENVNENSLRVFLIDSPKEDRFPDGDPQWQEVARLLSAYAMRNLANDTIALEGATLLALANYLCNELRCYSGCATAAFCVFVKLASSASRDDLWPRAESILGYIAPNDRKTAECIERLYAHRRPWPGFIRPCVKLGDYELCYRRWTSTHSVSDAAGLDSETREMLYEVLNKLGKGNVALQLSLKARDVNRLKNPRLMGLKYSDFSIEQMLSYYRLLLEDVALDWGAILDAFRNVMESCRTANQINYLLDIIGNSSAVRLEPKPSDRTASGLLNLLRNNVGTQCWPTSAEDVARAAAAFESIGLDKFMSEFGRMLAESRRNQGLLPGRDYDDVIVRIYVRGKRHFYDRDPRQSVLAEVREKLISIGRDFEVCWGEAESPFKPVPLAKAVGDIDNVSPILSPAAYYDEKHSCWCMNQEPLSIEVTDSEVKIWNTFVRRSEIYVSRGTNEIDRNGVPEDAGIQVNVENGKIVVRHVSWSDEIIIDSLAMGAVRL